MNRERLQMLRDMIAGIPQMQMNLDRFYTLNGNPCGTIACIAGWASIYPPFIEQGLKKGRWEEPVYNDKEGLFAVADFFDVSEEIFYERLPDERGTHKQIALRRLDALLKG